MLYFRQTEIDSGNGATVMGEFPEIDAATT
jgi:hypothetical protein